MDAYCAYCQIDVVVTGLNECPDCGSDCSSCLDDYCIKCEKFSEDLIDDLCPQCGNR